MKIVALIGQPAAGKTTLAREVIERLGPGAAFSYGLLRGTRHGNTYVFGRYEKREIFSGTDRLSMAVQPDAEWFIRKHATLGTSKARIFFEGDRLGNLKFLDHCAAAANTMVFLIESENIALRQAERLPKQNSTFLKSRATKIANIEKGFNGKLEKLRNDTPTDLGRNLRRIIATLS